MKKVITTDWNIILFKFGAAVSSDIKSCYVISYYLIIPIVTPHISVHIGLT